MKYLILGKKITSEGVKELLERNNISYDCLNTEEVENYEQYDLVIKSSGIKFDHEVIKNFEKRAIEVISDIELVYRLYNKYVIGVTGTNGKTSTTTYIQELLNYQYKSISCGNIGSSCASVFSSNAFYDYYVVELSSFMLNNIKNFRPNIAVLTNISKAHIDFHNTFQNYVRAKTKFLQNMRKEDVLIYNADDPLVVEHAEKAECIKYGFSKMKEADCYYNPKNKCVYFLKKKIFKFKNKSKSIVIDNVLSSTITAKVLKIQNKYIRYYFNFEVRNIAYRIQRTRKRIYNDSKSTNPISTVCALEKFQDNKNLVLICGGKIRYEDYKVLDNRLGNIRLVLCFGESKNLVYSYFTKNNITCFTFDELKSAVLFLRKVRKWRDIILFSPMHSSQDQFEDYKDRGEEFKKLVRTYLSFF